MTLFQIMSCEAGKREQHIYSPRVRNSHIQKQAHTHTHAHIEQCSSINYKMIFYCSTEQPGTHDVLLCYSFLKTNIFKRVLRVKKNKKKTSTFTAGTLLWSQSSTLWRAASYEGSPQWQHWNRAKKVNCSQVSHWTRRNFTQTFFYLTSMVFEKTHNWELKGGHAFIDIFCDLFCG